MCGGCSKFGVDGVIVLARAGTWVTGDTIVGDTSDIDADIDSGKGRSEENISLLFLLFFLGLICLLY